MARVFVVENRRYPDPDPSLSVDQVRQQFTSFFPELVTATASERREGEDTVVEFQKRVGTKG